MATCKACGTYFESDESQKCVYCLKWSSSPDETNLKARVEATTKSSAKKWVWPVAIFIAIVGTFIMLATATAAIGTFYFFSIFFGGPLQP